MKPSLQKYSRQIRLEEVGGEGQQKLSEATVLVVGAGGLGCPIIQYLAAAGVGELLIVDGDHVSESNLHRQIIYGMSDLGRAKVDLAKEWALAHNPDLSVHIQKTYVTKENIFSLLEKVDVVVDGSDNFSTKYLLNDACDILKVPLVSGAIFQFTGQVSVYHYLGGPSYRCLYPEMPKQGEIPSCEEAGVLGVLPGVIGSIQANEVLKIIVGYGEVLSGKLFTIDLRTLESEIFEFERNAPSVNTLEDTYELPCDVPTSQEITVKELSEYYSKYQLLDVREEFEVEIVKLPESIFIPLGEIEERMDEIPVGKPLAVLCHHGMRSAHAQQVLEHAGRINVVNIKGGIDAYAQQVDNTLKRY